MWSVQELMARMLVVQVWVEVYQALLYNQGYEMLEVNLSLFARANKLFDISL